MYQSNEEMLKVLYPLHKMFKLTGFIFFDFEKNGKIHDSKTFHRVYMITLLIISFMIYNLIAIPSYNYPILIFIIFILYILGDIFKAATLIFSAVVYKKNLLELWSGILLTNSKYSTLSGKILDGKIKFCSILVFLHNLSRFVSTFFFIKYENLDVSLIALTLAYSSLKTLVNFSILCNILLYVIFLFIINGQYERINKFLGNLLLKSTTKSKDVDVVTEDLVMVAKDLDMVAKLHLELSLNMKRLNRILSLQLLSFFAQNFWILAANCYYFISKLYSSGLEILNMSLFNIIYWILESLMILFVLIYPAHVCSKNVSFPYLLIFYHYLKNRIFKAMSTRKMLWKLSIKTKNSLILKNVSFSLKFTSKNNLLNFTVTEFFSPVIT